MGYSKHQHLCHDFSCQKYSLQPLSICRSAFGETFFHNGNDGDGLKFSGKIYGSPSIYGRNIFLWPFFTALRVYALHNVSFEQNKNKKIALYIVKVQRIFRCNWTIERDVWRKREGRCRITALMAMEFVPI